MKEIKSAEDIRDLSNAFRESRILLSAFELKIFSVLDHHMMTSEQVSKKIECRPESNRQTIKCSLRDGHFEKSSRKIL